MVALSLKNSLSEIQDEQSEDILSDLGFQESNEIINQMLIASNDNFISILELAQKILDFNKEKPDKWRTTFWLIVRLKLVVIRKKIFINNNEDKIKFFNIFDSLIKERCLEYSNEYYGIYF